MMAVPILDKSQRMFNVWIGVTKRVRLTDGNVLLWQHGLHCNERLLHPKPNTGAKQNLVANPLARAGRRRQRAEHTRSN